MTNPVTFFLSYPRSRTAWLSCYLTGMGVYCFHELWRTTPTIEAFAEAIRAKQRMGPVANADPSNWFFVDEMAEAFPEAQFIEILRPQEAVAASLAKSYGPGEYRLLLDAYQVAMDRHQQTASAYIPYGDWDADLSQAIWMRTTGGGMLFDEEWHQRCHTLNIQLTAAQMQQDWEDAENGRLAHLTAQVSRYLGGVTWVP